NQLGFFQRAAPGDGIDGLAAAVARHQDAVEVVRKDMRHRAQGRLAAALARLSVELARTLLRFEQKGFVGLDNACQLLRPVVFDPVEKTVTPAKRRVAVNADVLGGTAHRARIEQLCQVIEPLSFEPEPRQRRSGQVIEGASALAATESLQIIGLAMAMTPFAGTIGATASRCANLGNERDHAVETGCRMEG